MDASFSVRTVDYSSISEISILYSSCDTCMLVATMCMRDGHPSLDWGSGVKTAAKRQEEPVMQERRTRPATAEDFHRLADLAHERGLRLFRDGPRWFCSSSAADPAAATT